MYRIFGPPSAYQRSYRKKKARDTEGNHKFYDLPETTLTGEASKCQNVANSGLILSFSRLDGQESGPPFRYMAAEPQPERPNLEARHRIRSAGAEEIGGCPRPRSIFYDVTDFETSREHMSCGEASRNASVYELSEDIIQKQVGVLERKYGGHVLARHAAMTIQRAYRTYCLRKEFKKLLLAQVGQPETIDSPFDHREGALQSSGSNVPYDSLNDGKRSEHQWSSSRVSSYFPHLANCEQFAAVPHTADCEHAGMSSEIPPSESGRAVSPKSAHGNLKPLILPSSDPETATCRRIDSSDLSPDITREPCSTKSPLTHVPSRKISDVSTAGTLSRLKTFRLSRRAKSSDRLGSASSNSGHPNPCRMRSDPNLQGRFHTSTVKDGFASEGESVHARRPTKGIFLRQNRRSFGLLRKIDKYSTGNATVAATKGNTPRNKSQKRYRVKDLDKVHPKRESQSRCSHMVHLSMPQDPATDRQSPTSSWSDRASRCPAGKVSRSPLSALRFPGSATECASSTAHCHRTLTFPSTSTSEGEVCPNCGFPCPEASHGSLDHSWQQPAPQTSTSTIYDKATGRRTAGAGSGQPLKMHGRGTSTSAITSMFPSISCGNPAACSRAVLSETERKRQYRIALNVFNKKPEKGLDLLLNWQFVNPSPTGIAKFLLERKQGVSKQMIGEFLGDLQNAFNAEVLQCFANEIDFTGLAIDVALRRFQSYFRLPGEAQKIERIIEVFAGRYLSCNPDVVNKFKSPDTVFILSFAIIMLNTDLHSPSVKPDRKMKLEDFVNNLKGIDGGRNIDYDMLCSIYQRVQDAEFKHNADHVTQVVKLDRTIVGKKPQLSLPHRRLVCYCRLFEVPDIKKKQSSNAHQREVFLFNDIMVITKILNKKKSNVTYNYRESLSLAGMSVCGLTTQNYPHAIKLSQSFDNRCIIFKARQEDEKVKFLEDLEESVKEADEMEALRIEAALEKQGLRSRYAHSANLPCRNHTSPRISENRDSGLGDTDDNTMSRQLDVMPRTCLCDSGALPQPAAESSQHTTATISPSFESSPSGQLSGSSEVLRLRRCSVNSLDSGMSSNASITSRESTVLPVGNISTDQTDDACMSPQC